MDKEEASKKGDHNGLAKTITAEDDDIVELDSPNEVVPKRVISFPEADGAKQNDSDSDVLVIDIDDEVEDRKAKPAAETTVEKKAVKRGRQSISDDEDKPASKAPRRSSASSVKKFDQVENELEAMFAGIESEDCKESEASKAAVVVKKKPGRKPLANKEVKKEKPKDKKAAKKSSKKTAKQLEREEKEKEAKDRAANVSKQGRLLEKFKGPFVRVVGEIADPRWTNVVNYTTDALGPFEEQPDQLEQNARVTGFGYTLTTLSAKYDPRNVDESWICAFCRKQSHCEGLGDLFGPYFIPFNQWKGLNLPSPVKKSADLASSFIIGGSDQAGAKAKRRQKKKLGSVSVESPTKTCKSDQSEVWFHEDCIVWMPQIRLIGSQLLGLSEAIKVSQKGVCSKCNFKGSTIACCQIRCRESAHYPCAQDMNWSLDETTFLAKCQEHSN